MSALLTGLVVTFGIAAVCVITLGPLLRAVFDFESTAKDFLKTTLWALFCAGLIIGGVIDYSHHHPDRSANHCADIGGTWTRLGSRTVSSGKSVYVEGVYGCVD